MRRVVQLSIGILLCAATSISASEQPLEPGYFKWLLHLGQNPVDQFTTQYPPDFERIAFLSGQTRFQPRPDLVVDCWKGAIDATSPILVWTPEHEAEGIFADEPFEGKSAQIYHIYIVSPEERQARLGFRHTGTLNVWNNNEQVISCREWNINQERAEDFTLQKGVNAMTFVLIGSSMTSDRLSLRLMDRSNNEYSDLTFSLTPPLPSEGNYVSRILPRSYGLNGTVDVSLQIRIDPNQKPEHMTIIEYIPEGTSVVNPNGGEVLEGVIQWSMSGLEAAEAIIDYSLSVPPEIEERITFCGYLYDGQTIADILGDSIIFRTEPASPSDMAGRIGTIVIDPAVYTAGANVAIEPMYNREYGLVTGLRASQTGGWAEYNFEVVHPGNYDLILDYAEYWTMFHHSAKINATIDGQKTFEAMLFPTTHSYVYNHYEWATGHQGDPHSRAKWIIGSVNLNEGVHTLRLDFPAMYPAEMSLDLTTDGRPVIAKIIVTNYPSFTVSNLVDPHHLDSYEHPPARLVNDRAITVLADGCVEITLESTFYSLSQGDEVYSVNAEVRPRIGQNNTKFEIVSLEPSLFFIPAEGRQDFTLVVRSKEPVPEDYSELVMVWLQGVPSSPSRRLYYFSTARKYTELPPYQQREFPWDYKPLFDQVYYSSRHIDSDMTDQAVMFIPDKDDLGFDRGRYRRDIVQFFQDQFLAGNLPSVEQIFLNRGWDYDHHGGKGWDRIWSEIMATFYWKDDNPKQGRFPTSNTKQAKAYVERLSQNMAFYPVRTRWDWTGPRMLPNLWQDVCGMTALTAHIRTAQENMIDDTEQFKILHNLVLPIFNSYYDAPRIYGVLSKDVYPGDMRLPLDSPPYGSTGDPTDAFTQYGYVFVGDDLYTAYHSAGPSGIRLFYPLPKFYPKGTRVIPWNFYEDLELECRDLMSLFAIGAAARDPAVIDEVMYVLSEILEKEKIYFQDGSFRNEPGSYGGHLKDYPEALLKAKRLFGAESLDVISETVKDKLHSALIYGLEFPFSNGVVPMLNGGGSMNQLDRAYHGDVRILEELFPEDQNNIALYTYIALQEQNRLPGNIILNHNFVIHGWGYAMLRSEKGSWDRGMETLLSSKYLMSDPGDHVSHDSLGIVIYGLGTILTPRTGYSWIGYLPPFLNQVMVDDDRENGYYGSFWHFDGRDELPSAVAHTGDGNGCSELPFDRSRWCIQFPEYLFDAYFIEPNDGALHQYDWSLINMGDLEIVEPTGLAWQDYPEFLDGYWPDSGTRGAGPRTIAAKPGGRIIADWRISNAPWVPDGEETLLRYSPEHSGRLRLIMADESFGILINAQIGYYRQGNGEQTQANSQDILVVRKNAVSHAFVDTLEPIADDEESYVKDVAVVARGNHNQQLVKVTTAEGEDWIYLSGQWGARPDGDGPVVGIVTNADILAWRVVDDIVTRFYLAGGSYSYTPNGFWNFNSYGNHYATDNSGG